ncbi:MAG: hypothetical protein IK084_00315 [Bacteroidaceae bacterium]|nr:hypothetical protein [Bacteroidaceae bacterium]
MSKIDKDLLIAEIERRMEAYNESIEKYANKEKSMKAERDAWKWAELKSLLSFINSPQQEQGSVAEQFAKIVRENLSEIGNNAQSQFEQLYFEITGTKMYGGYKD